MDWPDLITSLQAAGVTQQQIAEHCNVWQSTVSELKLGKIASPSFEFGTRLVELHQRRVTGTTKARKAAAA